MTELKAIKWQSSNQLKLFTIVIYLKSLELMMNYHFIVVATHQATWGSRLLAARLQPELTKPGVAKLCKTELRLRTMTRVKTQPDHQDLMGLSPPNRAMGSELKNLLLKNSLSKYWRQWQVTGLGQMALTAGFLPLWSLVRKSCWVMGFLWNNELLSRLCTLLVVKPLVRYLMPSTCLGTWFTY